eukprot:1027456-Alexandrium_andersonii.AAC.1
MAWASSCGDSSCGSTRRLSSRSPSANSKSAGRILSAAATPRSSGPGFRNGKSGGASWGS